MNWKRGLASLTFCALVLVTVVLGYAQTGTRQSSGKKSELMTWLESGQPANTLVDEDGMLWVGMSSYEKCSVAQESLDPLQDPGVVQDPGDVIEPQVKKCKYRICAVGQTSDCLSCPLNLQINDTLCGEQCTQDSDCPGTFNLAANCPGGGRCAATACFQGCLRCP